MPTKPVKKRPEPHNSFPIAFSDAPPNMPKVAYSEVPSEVIDVPPDNGCWIHTKCLECPRKTCVLDEPSLVYRGLSISAAKAAQHRETLRRDQQILERYQQGESISAIAMSTGMKYRSISTILSRARRKQES